MAVTPTSTPNRPIFGAMTNPDKDITREILNVNRMGFDFVELCLEIPYGHYDIVQREREKIKDALALLKFPPVSHTPHWIDIWSDYTEVRAAWMKILKKYIDIAEYLGSNSLCTHESNLESIYKSSGKFSRMGRNNEVSSLKELVRYASNKKVRILYENIPRPEHTDIKAFGRVIESVPDIGVHLDVAHAFIEGGMKRVCEYIKTFGCDIEHIHIHDNHGKDDDHLGLGQGDIDFFKVMEQLNRIGYDKTITIEVLSSEKDLMDSFRMIKSIQDEIWH